MTVHNSQPIPLLWRNAIRVRRAERGWSQAELAKRIGGGMTQVNVSLIERGERDPLCSTMVRIFAALDMELDPIFRSTP